jgi:hypothetical protein
MHRQDETNFFLVGDGADKLLPACARQAENVFHAMRRSDFQVGLRGDLFLGHFLTSFFEELPFKSSNVQGSMFKVGIRFQ